MKALISIILTISLCFAWPITAYAMEQPEKPNIENLSAEDANEAIAAYNKKVIKYNTWANEQNNKRTRKYEKEVADIEQYNKQQDKLVQENEQALQEQQERLDKIAADASLGYTYQTSEMPTIDLYNYYLTDEPLSMVPDGIAKGLPGDAFAVDAHIYLKEGAPQPDISLEYDHLVFNNYDVNNILSYEGECIWIDVNQTVSFENQLRLLGKDNSKIVRYFDGYTNGYWEATPVVVGQDIESNVLPHSNIDAVEAKTLTKYQSVGVIYYYTFVRTGSEPETVKPFVPVYKELPQDPTLLSLLETMEPVEEQVQELKPSYIRPAIQTDTLPPTGDNYLITVLAVLCFLALIPILIFSFKNWTR